MPDGSMHVAARYTMRVVRNGRQHYFPLPSIRRNAERLADEISRFLDSPTMTVEEAIKRFNPSKWERANPATKSASVGDLIAAHQAAEKALALDGRTGASYRNSLLVLFRQGLGFRHGKIPSVESVNRLGLDELTPRLVSDFKLGRVERAGTDKSDVETKKRSANAVFRSIRGLFTIDAREHYAHLELPEALDKTLEGMSYRRVEKKKYRLPPTAVIERVFGDAWQLRDGFIDGDGVAMAPDRNAYLAWLLAAHAGLRKKEVGHAVREWIERGTTPRLWVRSTPEFIAKGKDEGFAEIETWVLAEIDALAESPSTILTGTATERTEDVFARLNSWLKARGLAANKGEKAAHGLRALCGSYWATTKGIFTAQKFLRHKTVDVTNDHYADVILDKNLRRFWDTPPTWTTRVAPAVEIVNL
ncbi:MAG: hypothetical protein Q8M02_03325 [Candidatus Didemnitutus sp.]|nr:hypothetical protein [Candidatus Didemnitutus sp.]